MSDIHLLGSIINGMENELIKYSKKEGVSEGIIRQKQNLIQQLSDVYDSYKHITMWEVFENIQRDVDRLLEKDKELKSVIIILPLREHEFDGSRCGIIDYTDRKENKKDKANNYLDKEYYENKT